MSFSVDYEGVVYTSSHLKEEDLGATHPALGFCHRWLRGQESFVLYTSGSTGTPKPIEATRKQMEASAWGTINALGLQAGDTALLCINTQYVGGIMMLVRSMLSGLQLHLVQPSANPFAQLPSHKVFDFIALVPMQLGQMLHETPNCIVQLNTAKAIILGGAPVGPALEQNIQLIEAPVFNTYGMTETLSHIALRRLNGTAKKPYFQTLPNIEIDCDARGCLRLKGEVTLGNWVQTNDLVQLHGPTSFTWIGRADNTINSGGIKIQLEAVEIAAQEALMQLGAGEPEVCAFAIPHPQLGQQLLLAVAFSGDLDTHALMSLLLRLLPKYHAPKNIVQLPALPQTPNSKTDRKALSLKYAQSL